MTYTRPPMGTAPARADLPTRSGDKAQQQKNKLAARRTAYRQVDLRDRRRCRACQRPGSEHHHVRGRVGAQAERTSNICLLCRPCHDLRHVTRTLVITGDADGVLTFTLDEKVWQG